MLIHVLILNCSALFIPKGKLWLSDSNISLARGVITAQKTGWDLKEPKVNAVFHAQNVPYALNY